MGKITKEKFKTWGNVFDNFTIRNLFELSSKRVFDDLVSPIALGKEANIFSAVKGKRKVIVKIYRLETCDFNRMYEYLKQDERYSGVKKNRRKVIFAWTQREFRNLNKARDAGIKVPIPYLYRYNLLFEEFIGDDIVAPKLKDKIPRAKRRFFNEVIDSIVKLYNAGIVHGDLSEFNILNHNEMPVFIDWSQAMPTIGYHSKQYFERDLNNVIRFFKRIGLKIDKEKILKKIK